MFHGKADPEKLVQKWDNRHIPVSDFPRTERYKYLGLMLLANAELSYEIALNISL